LPERIKLTSEELGLMSLFQNVSGATARDCILDVRMDRIIFVINKGEMGLAIGRSGSNIKNVQQTIGKSVELVEWADDAEQLISNALNVQLVRDVRLTDKPDGTKSAVVVVDQKNRGALMGREGRNAERARMLAKRYFGIDQINFVTSQ
jgi:transcription termination/antitermination protein NusA